MRYSVDRHALFSIPWPSERQLWILAGLTYGFLDPVLTLFVLEAGGFEINPVSQWFLNTFGPVGFGIQNVLVFVIFGMFAYLLTRVAAILDQPASPYRSIIPIMVAFRGSQLVVIHIENLQVLL